MKFLDELGIAQLWNVIKGSFVEKEQGKSLTSNDFTNTHKSKVDGIVTNGDGKSYLANDGVYKVIDVSGFQTAQQVGNAISGAIGNLEYVESVAFDAGSGDLTFTYKDESTFVVNLAMPEISIGFDGDTNELVLNGETDEEVRIPLGSLVPTFSGVDGTNIQVTISGDNEIEAILKSGTVTKTQLANALQTEITGKLDKDQGSGNAGKFLKVGAGGLVEYETITALTDLEIDSILV